MPSKKTTRIFKNTFMLYFRMAFTMLVALYTSRITINVLGVSDYGINSVVAGTVAFMSFLMYSMNTTTQRFLNIAMAENDTLKMRHIFSISITFHFILLLIIVVIGECVGLWLLYNKLVIPPERLNAAFWVFQFTIVSTATSVMTIPYSAEVIAHEKMGTFAFLSIIDVMLKLVIVFLLVYSPYDKLISYGFMYMCTFIINRIIYTIYCKRIFSECRYTIHFPRKLFKEMLSFAGWDLFGIFAWTCSTQGATILLNMFFGPVVNAARAIAGQVLGAIKGFSGNFSTAMNPAITKAYGAHEYEYMKKLMYSGSKLIFILLFTMMLPLFVKCHYVIELWLKVVPDYSVAFIRILIIQSIVQTMWNPLFVSGLATGKIKSFGVYTSCLNIVKIIVLYIALKLGADPVLAVGIFTLWEIGAYSVQLYTLSRITDFCFSDYFKKVLLRALVVVFVATPVIFSLGARLDNAFLHLVIICAVSCLLSLPLCYYILLDNQERSFVNNKAIYLFNIIK